MADDVRLSDVATWAEAQAQEVLLMGSLSEWVRPGTRWLLRLHFDPALGTPPFTLLAHALDGDAVGLELTLARLPVQRSEWLWARVEAAAPDWPRPRPCSGDDVQRETVLLQGVIAELLRERIEGLDIGDIGDVWGGGYDGYGVMVDFRSAPMNTEASFEIVNPCEHRRDHAHALRFVLWMFRAASRHLEEEHSREALRQAIAEHVLPERTWP